MRSPTLKAFVVVKESMVRVSDVLMRSLGAAKRLRAIEAQLEELRAKVGVQGHTSDRAPKNDIRDPMRHVDELLDAEASLTTEADSLRDDIQDASTLLDGLGVVLPEVTPVFRMRYVLGMECAEIAEDMGVSGDMIGIMTGGAALAALNDTYGVAYLMGLARSRCA